MLRLGTVESLSTPVTVDVEHRVSFNGETVFDYEDQVVTNHQVRGQSRLALNQSTDIERPGIAIVSRDILQVGPDLQRPLTQVTRSSYMTTSDLSRMSGLSDFPAPPRSVYSEQEASLPTPRHISVFNNYFEGERKDDGLRQANASFPEPESVEPQDQVIVRGEQVEFGVNQTAFELAKSLSSRD